MKKRNWVIECPARCAERGCPEHIVGTWRRSRRVNRATWWQARKVLRAHAKECWKSGPYRLRKAPRY